MQKMQMMQTIKHFKKRNKKKQIGKTEKRGVVENMTNSPSVDMAYNLN
jgi:hypothetical protein